MTTPDYYESVSESFRSELDDMIIQHRFIPGKINPGADLNSDKLMHVNMCPDDDNEIPMVIKSPGGITGLHYSINTVYSIKGATKQESDAVFAKINKELFVEKYTYDHWYAQDNDLLLFDNSITLHNRQGFIEGRLAYRLSHDYGELQNEVYQPYFQAEYQKLYNQEITDIVKRLGLKNFKLPKTRFIDHIPVIRNYF
jgi:alpha-ketoglutarate-dependent taurine dioxygenase